jgi:uncharacterized protein
MKPLLNLVPRREDRAEYARSGKELFATGQRVTPAFCFDIYGISSPRWHLGGATAAPAGACSRPRRRGGVRPVTGGESIRTRMMARFDVTPFDLTEMATAGGTADALLELGLLSCAGREDVGIDLVSAHKWFNLAALRGNAEAKRYRMEIAREMSKRQIAEAQRQAREWLARH